MSIGNEYDGDVAGYYVDGRLGWRVRSFSCRSLPRHSNPSHERRSGPITSTAGRDKPTTSRNC